MNYKFNNNIFILFFTFILLSSSLFPASIYTGKSEELKTIAEAIQFAKPYDTVLIKNEMYYETGIIIDKPLTLIGMDFPVINGFFQKGDIISIKSDSVIIIGIEIRNVEKSNVSDNAAIKISESKYCLIKNNRIMNGFFGIYLAKSTNCRIDSNFIAGESLHESSSGNGIHLWKCSSVVITNNKIYRHRDGIYFEFVNNGTILNNYSHENLRYGLHFMFSDSCSYRNNIFSRNGAGVAVMYTKKVLMDSNTFENNWGPASYGLLLKDINQSLIKDNIFKNNTYGINAEGSDNVIFEKNNFIENGWAVKIMANCENDVFTRNNFIGNTFDVATNSKANYNNFTGNYWSSYNGYDMNKDGIGDVPYHPVRLFSLLTAQQDQAIILLRSIFIQILDLAESIFPSLTPETLVDNKPLMREIL